MKVAVDGPNAMIQIDEMSDGRRKRVENIEIINLMAECNDQRK